MDTDDRRERRNTYLLYLAFVALFILVAGAALPKMADGAVLTYERKAARDPDGIHLKGMSPRDLGPENADRAMLFVHGFSGSPTNYNDLPDFIARDGWRVRCMVVPGHGTSPHDFEKATTDEMIDGVVAEIKALKAKYKHVVVAGHSLGGALVTLATSREPVDALVLYAPFFGLTRDDDAAISTIAFAEWASPWLRWIPRDEAHQPVAYAPNRKQVNSYQWIAGKAGLTALQTGKRVYDEGAIQKVACPVLLIHSLGDRVNSPKASEKAFAQFPNPDKRAFYPEKSDHVIFWDYDRLPTITETRAFLDDHFPSELPAERGPRVAEASN